MSFLLVISNLILIWSESILYIISILQTYSENLFMAQNLVYFGEYSMCPIREYVSMVVSLSFYKGNRVNLVDSVVQVFCRLIDFCLLSMSDGVELRSLTIIVVFFIFCFISKVCFMYFDVLRHAHCYVFLIILLSYNIIFTSGDTHCLKSILLIFI